MAGAAGAKGEMNVGGETTSFSKTLALPRRFLVTKSRDTYIINDCFCRPFFLLQFFSFKRKKSFLPIYTLSMTRIKNFSKEHLPLQFSLFKNFE